jgi:hypothetical protein
MGRQKWDRADNDQTVRVRVFINHLDFARAWQFEHSKLTGTPLTSAEKNNVLLESKNIRWEMLPQAILEHLDQMGYIDQTPKEMRAIDVYASADRANNEQRSEFETWLDEELDPLAGYQVHPFLRKKENKKLCSHCEEPLDRSEFVKGLNTKVACDLLSHAVNDAYDIAVLIMDDEEIVPSVLSVQEIFDKQIIHIGAKGEGEALRSAAWGHITLEDLVSELISSDDFKKRYNKRR